MNEDTQPAIRAIGASHTACKYEFRQNLRSHSWMECIFMFCNIYIYGFAGSKHMRVSHNITRDKGNMNSRRALDPLLRSLMYS